MPATRDTLLQTPNAVARTLVVYLEADEGRHGELQKSPRD
jgi:hypothetical protein